MGTGYYVKQSVPSTVKLTGEALPEEMIRDIIEGAGNIGIRAGIIGELGMSEEHIHTLLVENPKRMLQFV